MKDKARQLHRLRLLQRCFVTLRTAAPSEDTFEKRSRDQPYIVVRALADLDQCVKRFVSNRKHMLFYTIRRLNNKYNNRKVRDAKKSPSFKSFLTDFASDVASRIAMEQRLLLEAFEQRGQLDFRDRLVPTKMTLGEGKAFIDPGFKKDSPDCTLLPAGFKISKFRLMTQEGMGVIGWQTVWSADYAGDKESPRRGKWIGAGTQVVELEVASNDFVDGVEYVYESSVITGLRLHTIMKGWTKWVGGKVSESASTARVMVDQLPKDPSEESASIGDEELRHPGMPRNYITGFSGLQNVTRSTMLGVVVRRVRAHNIFSYYWIQDSLRSPRPTDDVEHAETSVDFPLVTRGSSDASTLASRATSARPLKLMHFTPMSDSSISSTVTDTTRNYHAFITSKPNKPDVLSVAESEFFNVLRMRLTELRAAEVRALDFARRIWSGARFRRSKYGVLSSITIVPGLTKWLFESLCKYLVPAPVSEVRAAMLKKKSRLLLIRSAAVRRKASAKSSEAGTIDYVKKAWAIALLGPKERKHREVQKERLSRLKSEIALLVAEADMLEKQSQQMAQEANSLLPELQTSARVCANFKLKIESARHLSSLLERMDLQTIKSKLAGYTKESSISAADMELIGINIEKNATKSLEYRGKTLDDVVKECVQEEREKAIKLEEERLALEQQKNRVAMTRSLDTKALRQLREGGHQSCRKQLAVNPQLSTTVRSQRSSSSRRLSASTSSLKRIVRIPSTISSVTLRSANEGGNGSA